MHPRHSRSCCVLVLVALIVQAMLTASCTTIQYRSIQDDFNEAVEIDNRRTFDRFGAEQVFVDPGFDLIVNELSSEYIAQLDPRLRPNAWMIRSVCQWRIAQSAPSYEDGSGMLDGALQSATSGLAEPSLPDGSRDKVLLTLMPALIVDTEIQLWHEDLGRRVTEAQYRTDPGFESLFEQCLVYLNAASSAMGEPTPIDVEHYVSYQRWRIFQNWRILISRLEGDSDEETSVLLDSAQASARQTLGGISLREAADAAEASIPQGHPLREIMANQ